MLMQVCAEFVQWAAKCINGEEIGFLVDIFSECEGLSLEKLSLAVCLSCFSFH